MSPPSAPLVMTHHAPVGAWTSLVFGEAGRGLCIAQEALSFEPNADLLVALRRGTATSAFPFVNDPALYPGWQFLSANSIVRTLSPCMDEFRAESAGIGLRIFTPHAALPNPKRSGNLQYSTAPGLLMDLSLDNSASDEAVTAFIGIRSFTAGRLAPLDWSNKTLCGIGGGMGSARWILAAAAVKDQILTLQSPNLDLEQTRIEPASPAGGILIKLAPRTKVVVPLAFAAYQPGLATVGIDGRYQYLSFFPRVEAVANFLLQNAQRIRESCVSFDARAAAACPDASILALFSQAVRSYDARTQLLEAASNPANIPGPHAYFSSIAPLKGQRNALDRAIDYLPWELFRNPWVIRNVFDLATSSYAYHDQLRFPGDAQSPQEPREGGMTFAPNFGYAAGYAPGADSPGWSGGNMATESLLNGIYLLTSYALFSDDTPWAKTRLPFARELLTSLENRDHWDPAQRTGILKAESFSAAGDEITVFGGLSPTPDPTLANARGNLYIAIKTFCASLMLTTYFQNNNDLHSADYSYAFAQKTAQSLVAAFDRQTQTFPANLLPTNTQSSALSPQHSVLLAAFEPLAVAAYLGLTTTLAEYFPELFHALRSHATTCLKNMPEGCLDPASGTLRLVSTSSQSAPAKMASVLFVLERLFQVNIAPHITHLHPPFSPPDPRLVTTALFIRPSPGAPA